MSGFSDYTENKLGDFLLRGQAYTPPATVYVALFTAAPSDSAAGTEVTGGSYARVAVACSMANFSGTQSAGSTTASTGTNGQFSNNGTITFPTPTADWGTVVATALMDASSGGHVVLWGTLTSNKVIENTDPTAFAPGSLVFQLD